MASNNYEIVDDNEEDKEMDEEEDATEEEEEDDDYSDLPTGGEYRKMDDVDAVSTDTNNKELSINTDTVRALLSTFTKDETSIESIKPCLPSDSRIVYVNPGFTLVMVNLKGFVESITARSILTSCMEFVRDKSVVNNKLKIDIVFAKVEICQNSSYYIYLKSLCDYIKNSYRIKPTSGDVGIPVIRVGTNDLMLCGCCGIQFNNYDYIRHAETKVALFQKFFQRRYSCCPWCEIDFDNDESALIHWFDEGHSIVSCRNITGETKGNVNDARLQKGLPLPYTPFIQSAVTLFAQMAPLASILLSQRVTKIDLANTNELPACLSIEMANIEPGDSWTPDCAVCNGRYYLHNTVHYSSIGAYDDDVKYEERACGHQVPSISKKFLGEIGLSLFNDMVDKLNGKKKKYGCATYKTAARKDEYDDEGPIRKRMSTLFENYRSTNTSSMQKYQDSAFNTTYSQAGHASVMRCNKWPLHSSYSFGLHINVMDEEKEENWCDETDAPFQMSASEEFNFPISNENIDYDEDEDDEDGSYWQVVSPPPKPTSPVKRKNKRTKDKNNNKENVNQYSKERIPFNSYLYRNTKANLSFLFNRKCFVEYDIGEGKEYRRYAVDTGGFIYNDTSG